jgi:FeS assembly SUF system regulator
MLRLSKLTDYAIVLLGYCADSEDSAPVTARALAHDSRIALPTVSKVMKALCHAGLVQSHRGATGGYTLSRGAKEISVADIIAAMEGPISLTDCSREDVPGLCEIETCCPMRTNWRRINDSIRGALEGLSLAQMNGAPSARRRAPLVQITPEQTARGRAPEQTARGRAPEQTARGRAAR